MTHQKLTSTQRDRAAGVLVGQACGDALGVPYEFGPPLHETKPEMVGGGLGRTPFVGKTVKPFLHKRDLLSYVEAILRVYNQFGRRDNKYKARIKILVHEETIEVMRERVEAAFAENRVTQRPVNPELVAAIEAGLPTAAR